MDKETPKEQNIESPEQIRIRNRKSIIKIIIILFVLVTIVGGLRFLFLGKGFNFGNVNGVSTEVEQKALTKINFIDSRATLSGEIFGNIKSPFTAEYPEQLWLRFVSGDNTVVGSLDKDLRFTKVYTLPESIKLLKLLEDNSILFTDEPSKEEPSLYYKKGDSEPVRFSTIDFLETYTSIYFEPEEKLIYFLTEDPQGLISFSSVNEKGQITYIANALTLNSTSEIMFVDSSYVYFQNLGGCVKLTFSNMNFDGVDCQNFNRNQSKKTYKVNPMISVNYSSRDGGELSSFDSKGNQISLLKLNEDSVFSKVTYLNNKLVFVKANLVKVGEDNYISKDSTINLFDLNNNQNTEITIKFPESAKNYYWFADKLFAVTSSLNSKLIMFMKDGASSYIYLGDNSPTSYAIVNQNWKEVDLGMVGINVEVLNGNYIL